jgi:hypothetical protein
MPSSASSSSRSSPTASTTASTSTGWPRCDGSGARAMTRLRSTGSTRATTRAPISSSRSFATGSARSGTCERSASASGSAMRTSRRGTSRGGVCPRSRSTVSLLHRHYMRREILTACGYWTETKKTPHQQGISPLKEQRRELLFVTLDKSGRGFSPTTRYRDFAISREEFHWETQNSVSADSDTARRYADHAARGWSIHLFVQSAKGEPFAYLGSGAPRAIRRQSTCRDRVAPGAFASIRKSANDAAAAGGTEGSPVTPAAGATRAGPGNRAGRTRARARWSAGRPPAARGDA